MNRVGSKEEERGESHTRWHGRKEELSGKAKKIEKVEKETMTNEGIACSRMHRWC